MTALNLNTKEYFEKAEKALQDELKGINVFDVPKITKVVLNIGVGRFEKADKEVIKDYLERMTGQVVKENLAKKSVAGFKLREGELDLSYVPLRQELKERILLRRL